MKYRQMNLSIEGFGALILIALILLLTAGGCTVLVISVIEAIKS